MTRMEIPLIGFAKLSLQNLKSELEASAVNPYVRIQYFTGLQVTLRATRRPYLHSTYGHSYQSNENQACISCK